MSNEAETIVSEFCNAWARLNLDQVMDFFTEDAVYHNIPLKPASGKAAIRKTIEGLPYCGFHSRIAYQPVSERRRDKRPERG